MRHALVGQVCCTGALQLHFKWLLHARPLALNGHDGTRHVAADQQLDNILVGGRGAIHLDHKVALLEALAHRRRCACHDATVMMMSPGAGREHTACTVLCSLVSVLSTTQSVTMRPTVDFVA